MRKRVLTLALALALLLAAAVMPAGASAIAVPRNEDDAADQYTEDWVYWCQGASRYDNVREWGCRVVAQAKLLAESGVVGPADGFDPDVYFDWCLERGIFNEEALELRDCRGPVEYAASLGREVTFLGKVELAKGIGDQCKQIMEKLREGCYVILSGTSHQAYVSREASLEAGTPILYDSWKSWSCNPATIAAYTDYRMADFVNFRYFRVKDAEPSDPPAPSEPPEPSEPSEPSGPPAAERDPAVPRFPDVDSGDWYAPYVEYVAGRGLMVGDSAGRFNPRDTITRGEVMVLLGRLAGADVERADPWYQKALDWAKASGVSDGTDPGGVITREQLAVMLYNFIGAADRDVSALDRYPDGGAADSWARAQMAWAVDNGVITGAGDGTLKPLGTASRGETAAMIQHFCERFGVL